MKVLHKEKKHVVEYCSMVMRDKELRGESNSVALIRDYQGLKKHKKRYLEEQEDKAIIMDDMEQELITAVETLEDELMEIEMLLQIALQEGVITFQEKTKIIITNMKEKTNAYHKEVSEQAELFHEEIKNHANAECIIFTERIEAMGDQEPDEDDEEFNNQLELFSDKEALDAILEQFKEFMDHQISTKETYINKSIQSDQ